MNEKMRIIYQYLCQENIENFTDLFYSVDAFNKKAKLNAKEKYGDISEKAISEELSILLKNKSKNHNKWINKNQTIETKIFEKEFNSYKISKKFIVNDKPLFTLKDFFETSDSEFKAKVLNYIKKEKELLLNDEIVKYKYLYIYDEKSNKVNMYEIKYNEVYKDNIDKYKITVYPPNNIKSEYLVEDYSGYIYMKKNVITIVIENENDILEILFNKLQKDTSLTKIYQDNLYGLAIGVDKHTECKPTAKKVIFRIEKFNSKALEQIYLCLNEMEILSLDISHDSNINLNKKHIEHYKNKIENIDSFLMNIVNDEKIDTPYFYSLAFRQFHASFKIFEKLQNDRDYFARDRKRIFSVFLNSLIPQKATSCYMVLPVYVKKSNVFLYDMLSDKKTTLGKVLSLHKKGIHLNIIFVIDNVSDCYDLKFKEILKELNSNNININFVFKKNIVGNSYDFFFDDSKDAFVVTKEHHKNHFIIKRDSKEIEEYELYYKKIEEKSFSYKDLLEGTYLSDYNPTLNKLVGEWFCYTYGSKKINNELKIWETKMHINEDYSVREILLENNGKVQKEIKKGKLTIENTQCLISLTEIKKQHHSYLVFEKNAIDQIFISVRYTKQNPRDLGYMVLVGIFSKKQIELDDIKTLLGNPNELIFKLPSSLKLRIDQYIIDNDEYY